MLRDGSEATGADYRWREIIEVVIVVRFGAAWCARTSSAATRSGEM